MTEAEKWDLIRLAVSHHREAARQLLAVVTKLDAPWAVQHLAERSRDGAFAFSGAILRERRA